MWGIWDFFVNPSELSRRVSGEGASHEQPSARWSQVYPNGAERYPYPSFANSARQARGVSLTWHVSIQCKQILFNFLGTMVRRNRYGMWEPLYAYSEGSKLVKGPWFGPWIPSVSDNPLTLLTSKEFLEGVWKALPDGQHSTVGDLSLVSPFSELSSVCLSLSQA